MRNDLVYSKDGIENTRVDIVLFHPDGEDVLLRAGVLNGMKYHVYDPAEDISYSLSNIMHALIFCLKFTPETVEKNFFSLDYLRILRREFVAQIIVDNLRIICPKVVLTWIDNSELFHRACKSCDEIPFLAIANSARTTWCATDALSDAESKYHIDEYFCYGPRMRSMFIKYGHDIKRYIVCGSLPGGDFFSRHRNINRVEKKEYDICLVSQWHKYAWDKDANSIFATGNVLEILASYVARYASEHQIKVCVALRSENPKEQEFFDGYFFGGCSFTKCNREAFSSYRAVDMSDLVVAINSSLSVESFGAGLKVLFVNPSGQERIRQTDSAGVWYLSEPTYDAFSERVGFLLGLSVDDYQREAIDEIKNVMSYDFTKPAHHVIRARLLEIISKS